MQNLFLSQSYQDCWEAYEKSLKSDHYIKWDYVILTASNEFQAQSYEMQIAYRKEQGFLPHQTKYVVLSDPEGKRVGSGGATLNVLRFLSEDLGGVNAFFGKRILLIHSGGDSKRVPQYSACGKIFSPVPRELPDRRTSTLFDETIINMSGVAGRLKEGMLVLSGDVLLLFNPLQIDFTFKGAAALSIKETVAVGKDHGVFLNDGHDYVSRFLHKQSKKQMHEVGAVNKNGYVDLDTGAVALDTNLMQSLFTLISTNGVIDNKKFTMFVNEQNPLSFYGDFLYPLAEESSLESFYQEACERVVNEELLSCRKAIWDAISAYKMRLISLTPAEFIHFGCTSELLKLLTHDVDEYAILGWKRQVRTNVNSVHYTAYNSLIKEGAVVGENAYVEYSVLGKNVRVGNGSIVSGLNIRGNDKITIPPGVVLHGLKLLGGRFVVRIYEVDSNPKDVCKKYISGTILQLIGTQMSLWEASIYPVCSNEEDAVKAALITYRMMKGIASIEEKEWWQTQDKLSMCQSFNEADVTEIIYEQRELTESIAIRNVVDLLVNETPWEEAIKTLGVKGISEKQEKLLVEMAKKADFSTAVRIYYTLFKGLKLLGKSYEKYEDAYLSIIKKSVYESGKSSIHFREYLKLRKEEVNIQLPVRVNWGGGWSDTPPHCMEKGGTVINAAIKIGGILPVQVTIRKIQESKIIVASEDVGAYGEMNTLREILDCQNPYDAFSLHKAALIACGVVPMENTLGLSAEEDDAALQGILMRLGGGLFISTQVIGIPKGSGLGTSSILAGACVKAIFEIMGEKITDENLYEIVLCMEQIMSTGGGWQDQVGGLCKGIKYITSEPGLKQNLQVQQVNLKEETQRELQQRFALIYTGQRRLARNLLRDVIGNYVGNRKESLDALFHMQRVAALMRFELEKGNIDELAKLFNRHWELSKKLDEGSTNTCIEEIFRICEDLVDGRFIAGAGGGGFLQVILKNGITREDLRLRLKEVFQDSGVDVWDSEFYW